MQTMTRNFILALITAALLGVPGWAGAAAFVQCPGDTDGDAIPEPFLDPPTNSVPNPDFDPNVVCRHVTGGDGFINMADGRELYIFSYSNVTGMPEADVLDTGVFRANFPAPNITVREGQKLYLTLTNVGTFIRPDLFDPHTIHYHGKTNASAIFDGVPHTSVAIGQQASLTYFYNNEKAGSYMWHCHVEATEHMEMGMLANLDVEPGQDVLSPQMLGSHSHNNTGDADNPPFGDFPGPGDFDGGTPGVFDEGTHDKYVYNDGDGSTRYDVAYSLMLAAMDHEFHDQSFNVQPLDFAGLTNTYAMINGRGYPDTIDPRTDGVQAPGYLLDPFPTPAASTAVSSQPISALITATVGQKILLRLNNLGVVHSYTVTALGLPMRVVGRGGRLLRAPGGQDLYIDTNTVDLGGGESVEIIIDTASVDAGTYFLYTTNLNYLSNNEEDYGGMMTEIVIN